MAITTGILIFDDAEELDFVGPWEVFTSAAKFSDGNRVVTIAQEQRPIVCAKGLRVLPDHTSADAPPLDRCDSLQSAPVYIRAVLSHREYDEGKWKE